MNLIDLKLSWRTYKRNRFYTAINIIGLSVAMAAVILIAIYVRYELSYDSHWENADRIYRVNGTWITQTGEEITSPTSVGALKSAFEQNIPGIETVTRMLDWGWYSSISSEKASSPVIIPMADSTLFDVFNLNLLKGNAQTAFNNTYSIVINESSARKFFGDENPIGKHLDTEADTFYTVTGVFEDISLPTHLRRYSMFTGIPGSWIDDNWGMDLINTYVMLQEGIDPDDLQPALDSLVKPHIKDFSRKNGIEFRLNLQPIRDIHLYSTLSNKFSCCEENTTPAIENIKLFSGVALLILIIACLNFINLSTARSSDRGKQVGIAKVLGATNNRLFRSFILESIILGLVSMILAVLICGLVMSQFKSISGINVGDVAWLDFKAFGLLILLTLVIGIFSGLYPALFLSGFHPAKVLKGALSKGSKGSRLRAILVIVQFSISISLIISVITVHAQVRFLFNKPLGYNIENIVLLDLMKYQGEWNSDAFKNELLSVPGIVDLTTAIHVPLLSGVSAAGLGRCLIPGSNDEMLQLHMVSVGTNFPQMLQMNLLAGRWLDIETESGKDEQIIINQAMVERLGFDDPIGQQIKYPYNGKVLFSVRTFRT